MQPFGLLNLLKSALFSESPPNASTIESERESPSLSTSSTEKFAEPTPSNVQSTTSQTAAKPALPAQQSEKTNACLDFLLRHEERAGRQKKR